MGSVYAGGDAWKLSPSDLTFLYEECRRCFWMKLVGGLPRPRAPFPKVFTLLDAQTKRYFLGKRTREIATGIRPGRMAHGERAVRSGRLVVPGHERPVLLAGRFDGAFRFDDGTFGIVDFKTTEPRAEHVLLYSRQLHAYTLAAENPAPGSLALRPVRQLGLLCVEPTSMVRHRGGVAYGGQPQWLEVPRNDDAFLAFLSGVLSILERKTPPLPAPDCRFCEYLTVGGLSLIARDIRNSN